MEKMKVKDIRNFITQEASIVGEDEDLLKIAEEMVRDPKTRTVYVVNKENKLAGVIPVIELVQYLYSEYIPQEYILYRFPVLLSGTPKAKDIMLPPVYVHDDEDITSAFIKMFKNNLKELPVVDEEMHVIGDLNILEMIISWIESVKNAD
ncbi:MAG: CBS domain-containing protein [Thermoplasmata archaeon]|nr:CBS domain-containing protein [Thermoplasmata archaeon]